MPRRRNRILPAIRHGLTTIVRASHAIPLVGLIIAGLFVWLAMWLRGRPDAAWFGAARYLAWVAWVVVAVFGCVALVGFFDAILGTGKRNRARQ